jgi:hypothetical protein
MLEKLARDKHPSFLRKFVNYGLKSFIILAPGHQELDALLVLSLGGEVERGLASVRVSDVDVGSQRLIGQENFQNFVQTLFGGKVNRTLARVLDGDVDVGAVLWVLDLEDVVKLFFFATDALAK